MDITIKREDIERLLERVKSRQQRFMHKQRECSASNNIDGAAWYDGAEYATGLTIDDLEILLEVADDILRGVYSIAQ